MTARTTRTFSLSELPEVFPTSTAISEALQRAVRAGKARKLAGRLYTRNLEEPLEGIARRNWQAIVAHYFPEAVVADRSALEAKPAPDGSLFLDAGPKYAGRRPAVIPGLKLRPRKGPGPIEGDMPYMGIYIASQPRAILENTRASRARAGVARTYSRPELEAELSRVIEQRGEDGLSELRDQARSLAPKLGAQPEMKMLEDLIGSVLGTRNSPLETDAARAHQAGVGFDTRRVDLFATLQAELLRQTFAIREEQPRPFPALSFFEAYFSNWIEGTEFEVDQAEQIVFEKKVPKARVEDAHDVLGTFAVVNHPEKRSERATNPRSFLALLRKRHAEMLGRRPEVNPGSFKDVPNRAGGTSFVPPELVQGTLIEGWRYLEPLPEGLSRAIFMMFLISEVHPFIDGNGRVGRVFMNTELSAAGEQRIVIPLSYRDDYLGGLRALSRSGDPRPLIRVLDFAQRYSAAIDWSDLGRARQMLAESNGFIPPDEAEATGQRLRFPSAN
ncbi:MAG TPA: Fic family protein [Solirubrobacterales bacterium]|nr:Fic family protein [Solirubrobacterales bacterium]